MTRFAVILAAVGIFGGSACATPIVYTETFTGSGTLGASVFTDAPITITLIADTVNVIGGGGVFSSGPTNGTVNVFGVGTATFTGDVEAVVNQGPPLAGIYDFSTNGLGFLFTADQAFKSYDLRTAIGPILGLPIVNVPTVFGTTLGSLEITFVSRITADYSTFTATTVPEPANMALLSTGLLGMTAFRRRRRA